MRGTLTIEYALTIGGMVVSAAAFAFACVDYVVILDAEYRSLAVKAETVAFVVIVASLLYGNFVYQFCRLGYWRRRSAHRPETRETLEAAYGEAVPKVTVLIPSYREESHVLRQAIMSAALSEYPDRRVVVLIDDPPGGTAAQAAALDATRRLVAEINALFAACDHRIQHELWKVKERLKYHVCDTAGETAAIAAIYDRAASWLEERARDAEAQSKPVFAHVDRLFIREILLRPAEDHRRRAIQLRRVPLAGGQAAREYARLAALFCVEVTCFERKQYENLSHRPNKAMNLNAYIGLMGRNFRVANAPGRLPRLEECEWTEAAIRVPSADYLLTLDADSLVRADYLLRLARIMQQDDRLAVVQTPYSAVPGAPGRLERIAGATTDIQYIIHQGFTRYDSTYWVGANALLRLKALRDICAWTEERGQAVPVFIQDRTVIEDTGSTVDLIRRGWTLYNYPERLAYSATPNDFGSLIIQRRRWSNGGLIILPDLVRYARTLPNLRKRLAEFLMRAHYLVSPTVGNLALLALLFYPFDIALTSLWLPLSAAPYYYLYGRDLTRCGYRWSDLPRVYALNLMLLPVNLAGVLRSLQQALTGRKAAFGRTPKIEGRTGVPLFHVVMQGAILACIAAMLVADLVLHRYVHAAFTALNAGFWFYALMAYIGLAESWNDLLAGLRGARSARSQLPAIASVAAAIRKSAYTYAAASAGGQAQARFGSVSEALGGETREAKEPAVPDRRVTAGERRRSAGASVGGNLARPPRA